MPEQLEKEKDIAYAQGFLGGWAPKEQPVREWLAVLIAGVDHYKAKCEAINADYQELLVKYNQLTAMSAGYLQLVGQQKELIDQHQVERVELTQPSIPDDVMR
jgi:hypothetical protein